jgi:four helix bundle protein
MQKEKSDKNLILNLTFELSVSVIDYCGLLDEMKKFTISNQLLKSATSIGANVREAQNAESKNDFIHKFKIAAKEADETEYWLLLCQKANGLPNPIK